MSRDIVVQDIPEGVESVDEIRDDWTPAPLRVTSQQVREAVLRVAPTADFTDPTWVRVELYGASIEVNLRDDVPLMSFAMHTRGDQLAADQFVAALLSELEVRALDPAAANGIFTVD